MLDTNKLSFTLIEALLIIAGFIGIAGAIRNIFLKKKLKGFGILFIAIGILTDAFLNYTQTTGIIKALPELANTTALLLKGLCFVIGSIMVMM